MNTAVINVKVDPKIKKAAQKTAASLGLSLSSVINGYLRKFIVKKVVIFSDVRLEPTEYTKRILRQNEKDKKAGKISPGFISVDDMMTWLNDPNARLQNGDLVR